jgi:hypothetical protein
LGNDIIASALRGKQKNFNIFSFPELIDVDNVFLAWARGKEDTDRISGFRAWRLLSKTWRHQGVTSGGSYRSYTEMKILRGNHCVF